MEYLIKLAKRVGKGVLWRELERWFISMLTEVRPLEKIGILEMGDGKTDRKFREDFFRVTPRFLAFGARSRSMFRRMVQ